MTIFFPAFQCAFLCVVILYQISPVTSETTITQQNNLFDLPYDSNNSTLTDSKTNIIQFELKYEKPFEIQTFQSSKQFLISQSFFKKFPSFSQIADFDLFTYTALTNTTASFYIPYRTTTNSNGTVKQAYTPEQVNVIWKKDKIDTILKEFNKNETEKNDQLNAKNGLDKKSTTDLFLIKSYKRNFFYETKASCLLFSPIQSSEYCNILSRTGTKCKSTLDCVSYAQCVDSICSFSNSVFDTVRYYTKFILILSMTFCIGCYLPVEISFAFNLS